MTRLARQFHFQLYHPKRILLVSLVFALGSLLVNGSLYKLYLLMQREKKLSQQIETMKLENFQLDKKLLQAKDPQFIAREAIDRYEMVGPDDLVFIFPEE